MSGNWKRVLGILEKDPSFAGMFLLTEQYGETVAAEMTDKSGIDYQRTYAEYGVMARATCGHLQAKHIGEKDAVVGLIYDTCMDWPVLMWGILMAGYIPLLMNPASDKKNLQSIMAEAHAVAYVAEKPLEEGDPAFVAASDLLASGEPGKEAWGSYVALCTSGTTGSSRIFLYDAQTIANHFLSFDEAKQVNPDMPLSDERACRLLAFLPFHHVFGFSVVYLLYSCTGATLIYLPDKSVPSILSTCQRHQVTHLYAIPMFFNALAGGMMKMLGGKDIHSLSSAEKQMLQQKTLGTQILSMITGGGHIASATLDFLNTLGYPLYNGFGMTETGIITVERSTCVQQRIKGCLGFPFGITQWKIEAPKGQAGELFLRGGALYTASMADGKIIPRDPEVWFPTGDLVVEKPDGLYIVGRSKDIIIGASGENIYPELLEEAFAGIPGVVNYCIVGLSEGASESVCFVAEPAPDAQPQAICEAVKTRSQRLSPAQRPLRIYFAHDPLPMSGNMKVKRQALKQLLEKDTSAFTPAELYALPGKVPASTQPDYVETAEFREILACVKHFASDALSLDEASIQDTDHFVTKLGGDSLTILGMFTELEKQYHIVFNDAEIAKLENCYLTACKVYCKLHDLQDSAQSDASEAALPTKRITDFSQSEEYQYLQKRMADTFGDGANPYFIPHDSLILDTSVINGKTVINLGSYNYLGMSGNPETEQAAIDAIRKYGTSASGSRTLAGEKTLYRQLEKTIAQWKHTEDAIVCTGGWATNLAFVSCFARKGDFIVYDALSHNSLSEGVRLSTADSRAFEHNNLEQLESILKAVEGKYNKVLVIVEGVYSMDGDVAPIPKFVALKKKYHCFLMVDEAHSGGVLGDHAGGVDDYFHLDPKDIDIKYGTMSKALGTCGGFIAADHSIVEYLRYNMNGFVFTAGIAPPLAAACMKAIEIIQRDNTAVTKLHRNIAYFVKRAKEEGMDICLAGESAIVPVLIGSDADAARISAELTERGVFVPPAMYPAVPKGQSRLRFTVSATHSLEQLEKAITETASIMRRDGFLQ